MQQVIFKGMKYLLVLPFIFVAFAGAWAQGLKVKGKVTDEKGGGLPGVTVLVKGTTTGTSTDVEGNYAIAVPGGNATLVITYIGYNTQEIALNQRTTINVAMKPDAKALEEVVVIGYSTVSKDALTGSVSSVGAKQLQDVPVSTAAEALSGRLAGVQVTTTEGRPGAEVQIRVRGGGSITQDNSPLYIVDGIRVDNALSIISPQEIQSIDVLKDAASTAIYGSQGANGVVIITTKGGRDMKTQITYNGYAGVRQIINKLPVMNPYDYAKYQYQVYNGSVADRETFQSRYGRYEDLELYRGVPAVDWQDELFGREAFSQTHVLGLTGGTKATTYNLTLNHADEDGIMLNSGFQRTLASFKFDHKATERLRVGFNTRLSRQLVEGVGTSATGSSSNNRLRNAVRYKPFLSPTEAENVDVFDPEYATLTNLTNPVLLANSEIKNDYRQDINVNGYVSYELLKGLNFRTTVGVTGTTNRSDAFSGTPTGLARQNANMPVVNIATGENLTVTNSNVLNYKKTFGQNHTMEVLVGEETYQTKSKFFNNTTKYLPVDVTPAQAFAGIQKATPPPGQIQDAPTTGEGGYTLFSVFGRGMYAFKDRYRATVTVRDDASSLFAKGRQHGLFPSAQLAWHIGDESFLASSKNWLSDLKMRVSVGTAGNNRIPQDLFKTIFGVSLNGTQASYYAFDESITPGLAAASLANPQLTWETTVSKGVGLDFSLFNRLNGSVDVYHNSTTDLLLRKQINPTTGYTEQQQNTGATRNKGIELQLDGAILETNDFNWRANFNISTNSNQIVSLGSDASGQPIKSYTAGSGWENTLQDFLVEVGKPVGQYYGYITDGYYTVDDFNATFNAATNSWNYVLKENVPNTSAVALGNRAPQPGDLKLKKLSDNGNMMIGPEDKTVLGTPLPKFAGGFNQQISYKGFDLSAFVNFSYGNKVYNANKIEFTTQYLYKDNNMLALMNDRWKMFDDNGARVTDPEQLKALNANTKYWTPPAGNYFLHSFAIEDGSYLRLSNLTLGYSLPEQLLQRTRTFSKLRVYMTANNLWTITGYSGYDPEANTRRATPLTPGVDYAAYPRSRYVLAGVNVTF